MHRICCVLVAALAFGLAEERAERAAERAYQDGAKALDARQWDQAIENYSKVPRDSSRADAALYWKAYALNRAGRRDEAMAALADLRKSFPFSRWVIDAKALELEVRQASGQAVRPETEADEDLKLMAINALMHSDPESAVPILDRVLQSTAPQKLKERALFVLCQSGSPRARETVANLARGQGSPELQLKAVEYLGLFGGQASRQALADIYSGASDSKVKRQVLRAFMLGGDRDRLFAAAKKEPDPGLRTEAIRQLGLTGAVPQLGELYQAESSTEVRKAILNGLFLAGAAEKMGELARNEKDPALRLEAIQKLGLMGKRTAGDLTALYASATDKQARKAVLNALFLQGNADSLTETAKKEADPELKLEAIQKLGLMGKRTGDTLLAMYAAESGKSVRKAILKALFLQHNSKALVDIARKETDPELKKEAVRQLSLTGSKEATGLMLEILNK